MSFKTIKPIWRACDHLSVRDAAALLAGFEPTSVDLHGNCFCDSETGLTDSDGISDVQTAFSILCKAIEGGSLPAKLRYPAEPRYFAGLDQYMERARWQGDDVFTHEAANGEEFVIDASPDWGRSIVSVADVTAWLSRKEMAGGFFSTGQTAQGAPTVSGTACQAEEVELLRQQLEQERTARQAAEQQAEKAVSEAAALRQQLTNDSTDSLIFPYATKELQAMRTAVADHWEHYSPAMRQPTQKAVGHTLGELLGLPRQGNGDPARKAIILAAAIKPDTLPND